MGLFGRIVQKFFGPKQPAPVALVLLLRSPRELPKLVVQQAIEAGIGVPVQSTDLVSIPLKYDWTSGGWKVSFLSLPVPYIPEKHAASTEARMEAAIREHKAAILIDVWEAPAGLDRIVDGINLAGKMAVPLVDSEVTAIFCFNTQRINLVDDDLLTAFREGRAYEVMETVSYDPVITGFNEDRMEAAIAEAQRRFPEFEAAYRARAADNDMFLVKFPFGEGKMVEHMWVSIIAIEGGQIIGKLENKPMQQPGLKKGSRVERPISEVSDWVFANGDDVIGGFTNEVLAG